MKYIFTIIRKMLPQELPKPTGRWKIEDCSKKINSKIDLSNEDHCGPCGQYALSIQTKDSQVKDSQVKDSQANNSQAK